MRNWIIYFFKKVNILIVHLACLWESGKPFFWGYQQGEKQILLSNPAQYNSCSSLTGMVLRLLPGTGTDCETVVRGRGMVCFEKVHYS